MINYTLSAVVLFYASSLCLFMLKSESRGRHFKSAKRFT